MQNSNTLSLDARMEAEKAKREYSQHAERLAALGVTEAAYVRRALIDAGHVVLTIAPQSEPITPAHERCPGLVVEAATGNQVGSPV